MKGKIKCKQKKKNNILTLGIKSPHKKKTISILITLKKLVITLLPQKDIWPQGKT